VEVVKIMGWKTSPNTNIYLLKGNEDGTVPANPELQALRWVSSSLEGSYETIANDTKLPGRNPSKNFKGTDQNAGDLVVNFAGLEHDDLFKAVLCSEEGFVKNAGLSGKRFDVFDMVLGNKQRAFSLLKEYSQDPKLYQLFNGLQFNTLGISFTIGALVKLTFGLMGSNNPLLEEAPPVSMANKLPAYDTEEFITLQGAWKFKGPDDAEPVEYIDGVDITLNITNNMTDLKGLFQKEAIDKSLGMLDITGTINEYVKDGKLYNLAKQGKGGELYITVYSEKSGIEYTFILNISFDNSTLSGDPQLQYALPFKTYGENRFLLRKKVSLPIKDISDVINNAQFNPGTRIGGIYWSDPNMVFDYIEIFEVSGGTQVSVARVDPDVQYFEPTVGQHQYWLRAKLTDGGYSDGVKLPLTTYEIVYTANLQSITIPMSAPNQIVLAFDNFVKMSAGNNAAGFSITGISDTLEVLDQPDNKTIRLKLATKVFTQNDNCTLSYDPALGSVLQNDNTPIAAITGRTIDNYSDYMPAEFVSAQVPMAQPSTLVLMMSRPIHIADVGSFMLTGTSAQITSVVTEGVTVEFALDEPVDNLETNIRLEYDGTGTTDDVGQPVEAFTNKPVTNNSNNVAITVQSAEVPSNNSMKLIVIMRGPVTMNNADGFSLGSTNQSELPDLSQAPFSISDGTISFIVPIMLQQGKNFVVTYDGNGSLRARGNNDKIKPFSQTVVNNSTNIGMIGPGSSARNLSIIVLGNEPQTPTDVTKVLRTIQNTVDNGLAANFADNTGKALGDYIDPVISTTYPLVIAAGHDSGGAVNLTANADLGANGKHIRLQICSYNGHKGNNGVTYDHVWVDLKNVFGYSGDTDADGHYMNPTDTNVGGYALSKGKAYLENVKAGLQAIGIPFNESWIKAVPRRVSKGGGLPTETQYDLIQDKLVLPTEQEMLGANTNSNSTAEDAANQGRLEYYDSSTKRIKRDRSGAARTYWLASPRSGGAASFCSVNPNGIATYYSAYDVRGFAPAFCIGAEH
jgi:hypothetical protein